jgi:hypothetical protein
VQCIEQVTKLQERFYGNQGRTEGEPSTLRTEHPGRPRADRVVGKLAKNVFAALLFLMLANTQ